MFRNLPDILKLARIQVLLIVAFIFCKAIRPPILDSGSPEAIKTVFLSLPNFFEGVIGVLILTGLGLLITNKLNIREINEAITYILALVFAGIYVISQEVKLHNLGGENIYDSNDIIASIIGLGIGYLILLWVKPKTYA